MAAIVQSMKHDEFPGQGSLTIEIKNTKPIELADLTNSLSSIAAEFQRHILMVEPEAAAADVRLYVREIKTGSVFADIIAISPQLLQGISYANAVVTFGKHLKSALDFLTGKTEEEPELDRASYQNLTRIVEPIAKDHSSQLNIGAVHGNVYLSVNSVEANAAQNAAKKAIADLKEPTRQPYEKVLLYWYQARGDATSKIGDKGIIETISKQAVKVVCINDSIKAKMILNEENPFKEAYIVDVIVETIKDRPALYNILAVHDKIPRED